MTPKSESEKKLLFVTFCIEEYKAESGIDGAAVAVLFEKYGVIDFLMKHWEVLHSLGTQGILHEINQFIEARRGKR